MRNRVMIQFIEGTLQDREGVFVSNAAYFQMGRIVEDIYGLGQQRLVCPLGYMQNLATYTNTGSRYPTDIHSTISPVGSYTTLHNSLKAMSEGEPDPYPACDTVNVFDNEQVVGKKRGVKPVHKATCSVITNVAYFKVEDKALQSQEHLKPSQPSS